MLDVLFITVVCRCVVSCCPVAIIIATVSAILGGVVIALGTG